MGPEILLLLWPVIVLHLLWLWYYRNPPGKRLQALGWFALALAIPLALFWTAEVDWRTFLYFISFGYLVLVLPMSLLFALAIGWRKVLWRVTLKVQQKDESVF